MDQVGDEGGEPVVVAEPDLVGGDGVVLVDDRQGAHGQQLVERAVGVAVVGAAADVVGGEQHLADADAVPGEGGGVAGDQQALADAGGGLLPGQVAGAARQAERREPGGDRAGGDEDHLAVRAGLGQDVDEGVHPVGVQPARGRGQRRGADLHHDPAGLHHVLPCRRCHLRRPSVRCSAIRPAVTGRHPGWRACQPAHAEPTISRTSYCARQSSSLAIASAEAMTRAGSPGRRGPTSGTRSV